VTYPGYPAQDPGESDAAHRFRRDRDAAHLDGLLPIGPEKRRYLKEMHAFILGIAVTQASRAPPRSWFGRAATAPDPRGFRRGLRRRCGGERGMRIDMTEIYKFVRREVFATCPRREVPLAPGQAVLVHRHAIHGVAPWARGRRLRRRAGDRLFPARKLRQFDDWLNLAVNVSKQDAWGDLQVAFRAMRAARRPGGPSAALCRPAAPPSRRGGPRCSSGPRR
jgi:hypothetical protein